MRVRSAAPTRDSNCAKTMPFPLSNISLDQAARLLVTPSALGELSLSDARHILGQMRARRVKAETVLLVEGARVMGDFMMLILDGGVSVEIVMPGAQENLMIKVLGPGNLVGAMGMLDDGPRSATCTAATDLAVAVLSRSALTRLMRERPDVAARFMLAVSVRLSQRLREMNQKLKLFVSINNALQQEIDGG